VEGRKNQDLYQEEGGGGLVRRKVPKIAGRKIRTFHRNLSTNFLRGKLKTYSYYIC